MDSGNIHIGCSSFNESYWKGIFYPEDLPRTKWFGFYAENFLTYEMNGTFYKFPTLKIMQNWYARSPEGYLFSVKAPKIITHFKKFTDCGKELADFYTVCREGLQEKLACVLFQLPPSFAYDDEKLKRITNALDPEFRNVIEFRHESWWNETVYKALSDSDIVFCNVSYPDLPESIVKTTKTCYFRFHGNRKLFYSGYSGGELENIRQQISTGGFKQAFVYFNNTASIEGIRNAMLFKTFK